MHIRWATPEDRPALTALATAETRMRDLRPDDMRERTLIVERDGEIRAWAMLLLGVANVIVLALSVVPDARPTALGRSVFYHLVTALAGLARARGGRVWFTLDKSQQHLLTNVSKLAKVYALPNEHLYMVDPQEGTT